MTIETILAPTDFSPDSNRAVLAAAALAKSFDAVLELLHVEATHDFLVLDISGTTGTDEENEVVANHFQQLEAEIGAGVRIETRFERGPAHEHILEAAAKADLLVMSTHARTGVSRYILGSTTEKVVRETPCPLLLIQPDKDEGGVGPAPSLANLRKLIVPTDLSGNAIAALPIAADLASTSDAELLMVHVTPELEFGFGADSERILDAKRKLQKFVADGLTEFEARVPSRVRRRLITTEGTPYDAIARIATSEEADLIVLATHGHTGFKRWLLGSTTERVARTAPCPVVVVPARSGTDA